ncbi:MAG TPA: hypothetical protein VFS34_11890 [Thermoanaerobaculia bacterium]|nr:hypothetical protein [Thermoanaerobaculia bacterium]
MSPRRTPGTFPPVPASRPGRDPAAGPGTGYPSVACRRAYPPARKIDRAFVRDLDGEGAGGPAVTLARGIGRRAVAEGIETGRRIRPAGLGHEGMPVLVASGPAARPVPPLAAARGAFA